jgi:hypothetical protein
MYFVATVHESSSEICDARPASQVDKLMMMVRQTRYEFRNDLLYLGREDRRVVTP